MGLFTLLALTKEGSEVEGQALEKRPAKRRALALGSNLRDEHVARYSLLTAMMSFPLARTSIASGGRTPAPCTISPRTNPPSGAPPP